MQDPTPFESLTMQTTPNPEPGAPPSPIPDNPMPGPSPISDPSPSEVPEPMEVPPSAPSPMIDPPVTSPMA